LGLERNLLVDRVFCFFDADGDGGIGFEEMVVALSVLCKGTLEEKISRALLLLLLFYFTPPGFFSYFFYFFFFFILLPKTRSRASI
jgi:Ca2+-binding EF-hand superfamily protein